MADENTTYTDAAGFEINLEGLKADLKRLDEATQYFTKELTALSAVSSHPMDALAGGGSPDAELSADRDAFVRKWTQAAQRLLNERTALINSVKSFTDGMHDVYTTYAGAEDGNAGHFRSIANT